VPGWKSVMTNGPVPMGPCASMVPASTDSRAMMPNGAPLPSLARKPALGAFSVKRTVCAPSASTLATSERRQVLPETSGSSMRSYV